MYTASSTPLRRLSGYALALLLSSVGLVANAAGQATAVVASSAAAVPHSGTFGNPWQSAVSNRGDFVLLDFKSGGLYEFPANGGPEITLGAPGVLAGGFADSGVAIDPRNNNLYFDNNYGGGLQELPYDTKTGTWDLPSVTVASGLNGNLGGSCGNYFQSAGLSINDHGVMAIATENGCGVEIFTVPIDASGTFGSATPIVANMTGRAKTVAIDNAGNISFNEDGGLPGVLFVPAGTTGLTTDKAVLQFFNTPNTSTGTGASMVTIFGNNVQGVTVDKAGNLYVADGNLGEFLVPLVSGVPAPQNAVLISPALASGGPSLDTNRGIYFVPTGGYNKIYDVVDITLNRVELGTAAVGATGATAGTPTYFFTGQIAPYSFAIEQGGTTGFALGALTGCGITVPADSKHAETTTTYNATNAAGTSTGNTCSIPITFTPQHVGDVSATLVMQDANGNVLNTTVLHGVGLGSEIVAAPGTESAIGAALQAPSQVALDASGNLYVADSAAGKVLVYAKGSGASGTPTFVGTGLTAPTGVAIDAAGDVLIADTGNIIEIPFVGTGLNAGGQFVLKGGYGTNLKLAADGIGDVFVADPDNQRVARLRNLTSGLNETDITGLTQLTAIGADGVGDLFIANGQNLTEYSTLDAGTAVVTTLPTGANGLAVDASGAVYVTATSGTIRIPNEGGKLNTADQITLAPAATKPTSVAVDSADNVYVTDAGAEDVDFISTNGALNFGALSSTTGTQAETATLFDGGNVALNVTGFTSTADYSETATTCTGGPIAVGASCTATITFNPGAGDQGTLTGSLTIQSDSANAPNSLNVTGVGAALAASTTTISVTKPTVNSAPISITVAPTAGTGTTPTGTVIIKVTGPAVTTPITFTETLTNGALSFSPPQVPAGSDVFTASYVGDRVYGRSTASATATVSQGAVMLIQPPASSVPTYVLVEGNGSEKSTDGTETPFEYTYPVVIKTADGSPLVGVPILDAGGKQTGVDYGSVTFTLTGGALVCSGNAATVKVNADGTVPFATNCLAIDTSNNQIPDIMTSYTFTPTYVGAPDPNYASVTGTPVTVIALRNPMVTITSNPSSLTITNGATTSATLTLTSLLGYGVAGANKPQNVQNYSLPLALQCDGLPAHATCSFSYPTPDPSDPNSVDVAPNAPGTVIMTINTNVSSGVTASLHRDPSASTFAAVFGFSLLGLAFGRKKSLRERLMKTVCLLLISGAALGVSACNSAILGQAATQASPSGTYQVSVTAKQVGSQTVPGTSAGTTSVTQGDGNQMSIPFAVTLIVK
ncbi:MAG: hypothetical protein ACRYFU_17585 [Janthinobacterium lividum]